AKATSPHTSQNPGNPPGAGLHPGDEALPPESP
ncbi:unnamed protein product, partial [marine sediment metagenome]